MSKDNARIRGVKSFGLTKQMANATIIMDTTIRTIIIVVVIDVRGVTTMKDNCIKLEDSVLENELELQIMPRKILQGHNVNYSFGIRSLKDTRIAARDYLDYAMVSASTDR